MGLMFLTGIAVGCLIGYAARCVDEHQRKKNGWNKGAP